ncbi:hypothetical protein M3Y98_00270300 [Aphelenchoides besseyi]|nr:hypothetical protein M3Y98_00270300 [Aphelenchoides besseyi]KAI6200943.1 hypothetical protein M3Y96_00788400 [Aphelenchoides besseyi]
MSGKASSYNLTLIAAYRKHPMLYDNRHRDYKVQNPTKEAWINVAHLCHSTPDECRSRWKALRDRFIKERKKRHSNPTYKVAWPLYNKMSFLEPFIDSATKRDTRTLLNAAQLAGIGNFDLPRQTIDNVVELLVREAQSSSGLITSSHSDDYEMNVPINDRELSSFQISSQTPDVGSDDSHELEKFYLKLIREVKKHQLLFDSSSPLYRVAAARNRVWDEIAESFGDGYTANELRTKWRSIRDRYIRERRLYKESLNESNPRFPKWPLYPEFAFLDFYVDQTMPRTFIVADNNNDTESIQSDSHMEQEESAASSGMAINSGNENSEADPSPSSSSSTPSTTAGPTQSNNLSTVHLFQRILQNSDALNGQQRWTPSTVATLAAAISSATNSNGVVSNDNTILSSLTALIQNRKNQVRNSPPTISISAVAEGVMDVMNELKSCVQKLNTISQDITGGGLEFSFGIFVANELLRIAEPRRSEIRRSILSLLTNESKFKIPQSNISINS